VTRSKWIEPAYLRDDWGAYNKAGRDIAKLLSSADLGDEESEALSRVDAHLDLIANWRAAHRYPLHSITMGLRQRAKRVDASALVVQRQKRLPSIIPKLERGISLTQIQDIGGCRAVLSDLPRLLKLHSHYSTKMDWLDPKSRSFLNGSPKNYIENPKDDVYRSIHYVIRYISKIEKYAVYDSMKIEMQIRTRAQHSWATAVEIVDFFTGEGLKSDIDKNQATPQWKRFFKLMGSVIALNENCPVVPGTPSSEKELIDELRHICDSFHVITKLEGYGKTVTHITTAKNLPRRGPYVIILNIDKRTLRIMPYNQEADNYLKKEKQYFDDKLVQVLQADAVSLSQLKRAYPNYDLDTKEFVNTVKGALF
jgi:hypothetical protein